MTMPAGTTGRILRGCAAAVLLLRAASSPLPAQQKTISAQSSVDWRISTVHSVVSLDAAKANISLPAGRNSALQLLEMELPALLKDTFFSIVVDSSERLGNAVARGEVSLADLNTMIDSGKKTPPYFSRDLSRISMTHTVSISQVGSLFIRHASPYMPAAPLDSTPSRAYSGILIDARDILPVHGEYTRAALVPCLLPKIWNENMDLLYEKNIVDPQIAIKRGIVRYSDSDNIESWMDLVGTDPLRITARKVFGTNRTDPVISRKDYLKIMTVPENRELLKNGKIVILCRPEELDSGILGPDKNDDYYFVWQDISTALNRKPVKKIDFSDTWEGLKLTMYDIRFIADSDQLLADETDRLDSIASALLLAGKNARFVIEGHTASVGKIQGEQELSLRRAARIAEELAKRGIPAERIASAGYGGTRPVAPNTTDEGRAMNRRVEIIVQTGSDGSD